MRVQGDHAVHGASGVGLPLEGIALVAGIDRILDMARTTVNITGDAACVCECHGT
ncbi:MAG: cation:dicarboxylate symporter family transporter [[Clostridium] scindens]